MTVNSTKITSGPYVGNNIADTFSYTFKVEDKTQLAVYETDDNGFQTLLVVDTDYTVNTVGDDDGGTITRLAGALPTDYEWYIRSDYEETQLTAFSSQGAFFPDLHEFAMDKLTFLIQQLLDEKDRSPSVSKSYSGALPLTLDDPVAGKGVRWKGDLSGLENFELTALTNDAILADKVVINHLTLASALADSDLVLNNAINLREHTTSKGGGAMWDVYPSGTFAVGATIFDVFDHDTLPLQLKMRRTSDKYISAAQWGLFPGEIVNVALFKALLVESQATARDVSFRNGNYDFNNQDVSNGGLSNGQDVGSVRAIGVRGFTAFSNIGSAHYSGFIKFRDINFTDCVQPIYMSGNIGDMDIAHNTFTGCRRSIYHNDTTALVKISGGHIHHNLCTSHTEDDFVGFVLLQRAPLVDDVLVEHNTIKDIQADSSGTNIFSGILIGNDNHPVNSFNRNKANNNTILNCGNAQFTFANPSFGIVVIGLDSEEDNNIIRDGKWLEPMYMKGNRNSQCGNKLHDNQHSGVTMKIMLDTNASEDNFQNNNVVTGQCDIRPAMRMFGDGQSLNSQVDITTTAQVDSQGGFAYQCTRSTTIDGLLRVTGQFEAPKGISITTAGDVELDVNLTSDSDGITIIKSTDGDLGDVIVNGKVDCLGQALNVNWCEKFSTNGLDIECDRSTGDIVFVYAQSYGDMDSLRVKATDRLTDGLTLTQPISLFAKDGGSDTNSSILLSDFKFLTERNITQVIRYNADAGLLAPDEGRCTISNGDVDLNGNTCSFLFKTLTSMKQLKLHGVDVEGTMTRTVDGGGTNIGKLIIDNCVMDYVATDNLAGHTNTTVTTSRITNNITA